MVKANDSERREYFRIEDNVYLEINNVTDDEYSKAPEILNDLHNSSFSLSADFATLNNNINPVLNNIRQHNPDIAQYLEFINQKIDSLSEVLLRKDSSFDESKVITANVSASGIMFQTTQSFSKDQKVKLELVLLPEKIGILIYGKVVASTTEKDTNKVSIEFEHLRDEDQELMIKHNLNKQMADLREKNDNN